MIVAFPDHTYLLFFIMKGYMLCTLIVILGGYIAERYMTSRYRFIMKMYRLCTLIGYYWGSPCCRGIIYYSFYSYRFIMKGYSLFTLMVILGGCLALEELYINGSKRFITDGVSTHNIKDGLTTAAALINQIDTKDFSAVMKNAVSAASKYLGILNPLLGFVFSLFGSGPSAELQAIKHLFNTMQHRFDLVDQKFAQLNRAISFVPTQVSLNDIEGSIKAMKKEYGYLSSATSAHGYNSQKRAYIRTYDGSYHGAGTKLYHSIMSGTVANRHTGLFQEYATFTVYDRKQVQNFMLGAFNLLLQASALEITYASLRHYSNFAQRVRDWDNQIKNVVNKMKGVDNDIVNNYHVYSGNDIWHDDTIYNGVHSTQDVANNLYNKLIRKVNEPRHEISNNVVCATSKTSDEPVHTRSLTKAFACRLGII